LSRQGCGYQIDGKTLDYLPADANLQARLTPVLKRWKAGETTAGARSWPSFPPMPSNMSAGWRN
jgi:adenylosuccinate synthase